MAGPEELGVMTRRIGPDPIVPVSCEGVVIIELCAKAGITTAEVAVRGQFARWVTRLTPI